jgi:luciferase family oxidoreductase group 1
VSQQPVALSVLDLSPITEGSTAADALRNSLDLARHAERLGYRRHWVAEHHNMPGIASAATAVVVGHIAAGTSTIRVGAGGIMLPNHAPLVIAEQFGTLESLYPGRIDLGLGRAPGTDPLTARALRRDPFGGRDFPHEVLELQRLFGPVQPGQAIRAVPGAGLGVPLWILGSSTYGAGLAAALGLPYAFASHFAPADLLAALELYRSEFRPSEQLAAPYAMAGLNVYAADTDEEARRLFTTPQQAWANRFRGEGGPYPAPIDDIEAYWTEAEKAQASSMLTYSLVGSAATVRAGLERFVGLTGVDEVMVVSAIHDHGARVRSYELLAAAAAPAAAAATAADEPRDKVSQA